MKRQLRRTARPTAHRRGSVYVAVMGVATIVSAVGLCSLHLARLQLKSARDRVAIAEARWLAQSGVDFALARVRVDSTWRSVFTSGVESSPLNIGNGQLSYIYTDTVDGNLANNNTDPVEVTGVGRVDGATFAYRVTALADGDDLAITLGTWRQTAAP